MEEKEKGREEDLKDEHKLILLLSLGAFLRAVLAILFTPVTDVYYFTTEGVRQVLSGKNPYQQEFHSIPPGLETPGSRSVFPYLPGILLFLVPFQILGDVRLGGIAGDMILAFCMYAVAKHFSGRRAMLVLSFYLFFPAFPLVTSIFANIIMVSSAFLALSILLIQREKKYWVISYCLSLLTSQLTFLTLPFFLHYASRVRMLRLTILSLVIASSMVIPFLLPDPLEFLHDTASFQLSRSTYRLIDKVGNAFVVNIGLNGVFYTLTGIEAPLLVRLLPVIPFAIFALRPYNNIQSFFVRVGVFLSIAIFLIPKDVFPTYFFIPLPLILPFLPTAKNPFTSISRNSSSRLWDKISCAME